MSYLSRFKWHYWFAAVLGLTALTVSACSESNAVGTTLTQQIAKSATTIPFTYETVKYPLGSSMSYDTELTGIDANNDVVGTYVPSSVPTAAPTALRSFVAPSPYTNFTADQYKASTVSMQSITIDTHGNADQAGWATGVHGQPPTQYFGALFFSSGSAGGIWLLLNNAKKESTCNFVKLFGVNEKLTAVGYLKSDVTGSSCAQHDFLYTSQGSGTYTLDVGPSPSTDPIVTGINNQGSIVGTATIDGLTEGWYMLCEATTTDGICPSSKYAPIQYVTTHADVPITLSGINDPEGSSPAQVVGTIGSGSGSYGFIANAASTGYTITQTITVGTNSTVLTGINDNHYICGWFIDNATPNRTKGFVGVP